MNERARPPLNHRPPEMLEEGQQEAIRVGDVDFYPETIVSSGDSFAAGHGILAGEAHRDGMSVPAVLKEYSARDKPFFEHALSLQRELVDAGLRATQIVAHDDLRILSADLNHSGYVALSSANPSTIALPKSIEHFEGFDEVVTRLLAEAVAATEKGFFLPADAYFILIDRGLDPSKPLRTADFFLGDFDRVRRQNTGETASELFDENIRHITWFLASFIKNRCAPRTYENLITRIIGTSYGEGPLFSSLSYALESGWIDTAKYDGLGGTLSQILKSIEH